MAAISGEYGSVYIGSSCVAEVDRWSVNKEAILHDYATCSTPSGGGTAVLAGRKRHTGSMSGIYDATDPIENYFDEGDSVTALFYIQTQGVLGSIYYTGTCVIENINIPDVDITEGAPIRWESAFRVHGLLTRATDAGP